MMRMRRALVGLTAGCLTLAACGDSGGSDEAATTIRVWTHQNDAFNEGLQSLADQYTADHPEVAFSFETFDYDTYIQTLQTSLPAGTEADILQVFGSWTCSYADNLAPVPDSVLTATAAEESFFPAAVDGYICDDALYGMPQEYNVEYGAALVNTDLVEATGWDSWDDLIADLGPLSEGEDDAMTRAGYMFTTADGLAYSFYSMILQQGGSYLADDGSAFTIDTPEGRAALEQLVALVDANLVNPVLYTDETNWVGDCFFETTCAAGLIGPWVVAEYADEFPDVAATAAYAPLPSMGDEPTFAADSGWGLTVSASSEAAEAAWDFISFATLDPDNALAWNTGAGTLPALQANAEGEAAEVLVADFPQFGPFLDLLPEGRFVGHLPDRDLLFYDITYPHVLNVLQGNETVDDALAAMEREANETIGG